jgi:threonine aldolase
MQNAFDEIRNAMAQARDARRAVDQHANAMADLLEDSLRSVSGYRLAKLKRALRDFNIHTGRWMSK